MRSDTQAITIGVKPKDVVAFISDGANLPRWAIGFAKSVRREQAGWIVTTSQGEVPTAIAVEEATGTVDFRMEPAPGAASCAFTRVVPNGEGAEFVFTHFQQPCMPNEVFDQLVSTVAHELVALKALLEVACPL